MSAYDEFRDLAVGLMVAEFGRPATLTRNTSGYDPDTDTVTISGTSVPIIATLAPLKVRAVDERITVTSAVRLLVRPAIGDTITFGTESYTVDSFEVAPGEVGDIIYLAEVSQ